MSMGAAPTSPVGNISSEAAEQWHKLLKTKLRSSPKFTEHFYAQLHAAKLTFGNRVHCPFLRPFFLSSEDEQRVRVVAETMAELAERVTDAAMKDAALLAQFHLRDEELRLVRLGKIAGPASTASRLDAFLLPDSLKFAEYNGESPAGAGYSETLAAIFRGLPVMSEFRKSYEIHSYPLSAKLLDALVIPIGGKCPRGRSSKFCRDGLKKWACRWSWLIRATCTLTASSWWQTGKRSIWFTGGC